MTSSTGQNVRRTAFKSTSQTTSGATNASSGLAQNEKLRDAENAGNAGRRTCDPGRAESLHGFAAHDQIDRIAHGAGEDEGRAEDGLRAADGDITTKCHDDA